MTNNFSNFKFYLILCLVLLSLIGCKASIKPITLISKTNNYLINVQFKKNKGNDYFGDLHFANLSGKDLQFMLTENLFTKNKYNIFIKYKNIIFPLYSISPASLMLVFPKEEIKIYKIRANNLPANFNWSEATIGVNNGLFK